MKRSNLIGAVVGAVAGLVVSALAGMEDVVIVNDQSLANAAAYTNHTSIRGNFEGIFVKIEDAASAVRTNTVAVTTADGQTLFSAAVVGVSTNFYPIRAKAYTTAAALVNESTVDATTNNVYVTIPVASKVTCTVTGASFPTLTNSVTVRLLFRQ